MALSWTATKTLVWGFSEEQEVVGRASGVKRRMELSRKERCEGYKVKRWETVSGPLGFVGGLASRI